MNSEDFITATQHWLNSVIIQHNICPFAKKVIDEQRVRFIVNDSDDIESLLLVLIEECELLNQNNRIETTLLIYSNAFSDFNDYLDFVFLAEELLSEQGYEGSYQLASFHPHYCFEDANNNDAANYTNRSPYPMLHLLRENSITQAIKHYPLVEEIPNRNIELTRTLGLQTMQNLLEACYK